MSPHNQTLSRIPPGQLSIARSKTTNIVRCAGQWLPTGEGHPLDLNVFLTHRAKICRRPSAAAASPAKALALGGGPAFASANPALALQMGGGPAFASAGPAPALPMGGWPAFASALACASAGAPALGGGPASSPALGPPAPAAWVVGRLALSNRTPFRGAPLSPNPASQSNACTSGMSSTILS